ncbi:MAG: TetR family transcriptional regulator C-terminal domain-containing protein [Bacteroidota bacterium]
MRKRHSKEALIVSGMNLIRRQGYHHTGINDILKAAQIPKGSFYNFFESKQMFGEAVIKAYGDQQVAFLKGVLDHKRESPLKRIETLYRTINRYHESEDFRHGCLVNNISIEVAGVNDKLAEVLDTQFRRWVDIIAACIAEGQQAGEIRDDISAHQLAHLIHTNLYGAHARMKAARNREALDMALEMNLQYIQTV